ncbi:hypothetical protein [Niallia sp. FSL W8-0635]|uniref:hypothetical protein n=1 Tax=Niallia sp. FSL W8-0635 TaxID=2975337 RepID=UPI0009D36490|nr:Uncharacterised protein [Mycobacteroides abscessus subsp. abscessus]
MENASKRLQILMGDTLQLLDHMKVDADKDTMLQQVKNDLQEQNDQMDRLTKSDEEITNTAISMTQSLDRINNLVQQLEASLMEDYQASTGGIDEYQHMSIDEQREQPESYHDKIDYLSAVKIRENINRMNEVLLSIRS